MEKVKTYSVGRAMVQKLYKESDEKHNIIQENLIYYLSQDIINPKIISILCDAYSSNYYVRKETNDLLEYHDENADKEKDKNIAIDPDTLVILETALISGWRTSKDLASYHISLRLN